MNMWGFLSVVVVTLAASLIVLAWLDQRCDD
jgi:hypothetical protein